MKNKITISFETELNLTKSDLIQLIFNAFNDEIKFLQETGNLSKIEVDIKKGANK